jgi:5-(carboxyamino)imidazole ribonucleotide synthase
MTIGVLGGGQLGRMLALAGYPLGLRFRFLDPSPQAPAGSVAESISANYDDQKALARFAAGLDLVTYEFENVPAATAHFLAHRLPIYPPPEALEAAQDRLAEKTLFRRLGIPVPEFAPVNSWLDLEAALKQVGLPAVLKTRRLGYDGKGQFVLRGQKDAARAWQAIGETPLLLERFIRFERELSILAVQSKGGESRFYSLVENHHKDGILRLSLAPAPNLTPELQTQAEDYATRVLEALDYVGVLAIELFQCDGGLLANEMACRVHNSGHWSIEGAATSQFENHLRAVCGLPLGATTALGCAAMLNLIGTTPQPREVLAIPDTHLHLYGKSARPGRKLGHVTVRADNQQTLEARLEQLRFLRSD